MLRLICSSLGTSAGKRLLLEAENLPFGEAMFVTAARSLKNQVRASGVYADSFDSLVKEIVRISYKSFRLVSQRTQELVIESWVRELKQRGQLQYFDAVADKAGFVKAVAGLLGQLARTGVEPQELTEIFKSWAGQGRSETLRRKDRDVALLYRLYRSYLERNEVYDMGGLYRLAATALSGEKNPLRRRSFYFYGFYAFDALQLKVIAALCRICDVTVALVYETGRPELFAATEWSFARLSALLPPEAKPEWIASAENRPAALEHLTQNLGAKDAEKKSASPALRMHKALDARTETEWVLADVKARLLSGTPADQIALAVRDLNAYGSLRQEMDKLGIPSALPLNASLSCTPLAEYLSEFLDLQILGGAERARAVLEYLRHPWQKTFRGLEQLPLGELLKRRYYVRAEDVWDAAAELERKLTEPDGRELVSVVRQLREETGNFPREATAAEFCSALTEIVAGLSLSPQAGALYKNGELDLLALHSVLDAQDAMLLDLKILPQDFAACGRENERFSVKKLKTLLEDDWRQRNIKLEQENAAGVAVKNAAALDELRFSHVYLLGMREKEFPRLVKENWLYDEKERAALCSLGLELPTLAGSLDEDRHFFATACAAAEKSLTLTWYEDEEKSASPYIKELQKIFTEDSWQGDEVALPPERGLRAAAETAARADELRQNGAPKYNGRLKDPELLQEVRARIGTNFSASSIESYVSCPFAYLGTRVWNLAGQEEAGEEMDGGTRGKLIHRALEHFVGRRLGESLRAELAEKYRREISEDFDEACRYYIARGEIYAGEFWQANLNVLRQTMENFLEQEIEYSKSAKFVPVATEVVFGGRAGRKTELRLTLPLEDGALCIAVQGRIDRMDAYRNFYFITDYKTGAVPSANGFLTSDFQLPLYILAAQDAMNLKVLGGGYYAPNGGGRRSNFSFSIPEAAALPEGFTNKSKRLPEGLPADARELREQTVNALTEIIGAMRSGEFPLKPAPECEKNCVMRDVCRKNLYRKETEDDADV